MKIEMAQPVVYLTKSFFLAFINQHEKSKRSPVGDNINERKKLLLLEELLVYNATIHIDISTEDYNNYVCPDFIPQSEEEKVFQVYFNILAAQNKIETNKNIIECFRQQQYEIFNQIEKKPNYVFLSEPTDFCKIIAQEFGVICLSKELDYNIDLFEVVKKTVNRREEVNLNRGNNFINHLPYSHTIEIVDPFLLGQNIQFIVELIKSLAATKVQISLTIRIKNNNGINIGHIEQTICQSIQNIKNNFFIKDERLFHNRHITTNTFFLLSDYGFMRRYGNDNANWITFPLNKEFNLVS